VTNATKEDQVGTRLRSLNQRLATAESCSGGLIAHRITNVAGSSDYFAGGVVTYANDAKIALLGVKTETLFSQGAVSDATARQMCEGVRARFGVDYGVACTGIAGPGGGSPEKPVGLVYIGVASPGGTRVEKCEFQGDRMSIKQQTADHALALLLESLG